MRIALNIEKVGVRFGGAEKYVAMLGRTLAQAGHAVQVVARVVAPGELPDDIEVTLVPDRPLSRLGWMRAWEFGAASERILARQSPDLIVGFNKVWYQHAYVALAGAHPASLEHNRARFRSRWARAAWNVGKVLNPTQWAYRAIDARQFAPGHCPFVVAPSRMVAEHFQRFHGVSAERIAVVPNGIELRSPSRPAEEMRRAFRAAQGLGPEDVAVLFVARNYALKGLEQLLEAFAPVARRSARARLIACGSERDTRFRSAAERLGITDRVRFLGFVKDSAECFAGCDLFAFPTFYDPCSLVVPEAQAAGLPVITTRQNGAGELLTEGIDGYVVDSPWSVGEMSDRIERLVEDPDLRQRMGREALRRAPQHDINNRITEMLVALEEISSRSANPAPRRRAA